MRLAVALLAALAALINGRASALTIVEHGVPKACVVLPEKPSQIELKAASELQRYIKKITGADLTIRFGELPESNAIVLGKHPFTRELVGDLLNDDVLGYDGIILKTAGNRLILAGHKGQSQLYAVYSFLQRLGCRFYLPHPDGEVVPRSDTIAVDSIDYVHKPDFLSRVFWNNNYVRPGLAHPDWYDDWATRVFQGGLEIRHSHIYKYICPEKTYFSEHPEYFPLIPNNQGGLQRAPKGQLCLSNPGVVRLAADYSIESFRKAKELACSSLSPNDSKGWCQCESCTAMDSPDPNVGVAWRVLKFNNQVAEIVAREFPDKWLAYYAEYMNLPGPPVGMKAHKMIMPVIVNRYDMMHSIHDDYSADTSATGIRYNNSYRKLFDTWKQIADRIMVYEWYQLGKPPQLPSPMLYPIGERIKFYKQKGVVAYYGEVIGRSPVNDLTIYVAAQMLWDSNQNPDDIVEEFFRLYFEEASSEMREYYRLLHKISYFSQNRGCYVPRTAWSAEFTAELDSQLLQAERSARGEIVKRRIDRERKCLTVAAKCATAFQTADKWFESADTASRSLARVKANEAIEYIESISDEDIVADTRMVAFLKNLLSDLDKQGPENSEAGEEVNQVAH